MQKQEAANRAWLAHALVLSLNELEKSCYYDSQHKHFFKLDLRDFIAFDGIELNNLETNHTPAEKNMIREKLGRLRRDDPTIISIHRLASSDRNALQASFVDQFKGIYHHKQLLKVISEQNDSVGLALDKFFYTDKHFEEIRSYWHEHRDKYLSDVITDFAATYHIDLACATIWSPARLDVGLNVKDPTKLRHRVWWKLW